MKIKNIIKKNLFGFIVGGIIFGTITTVLATSIAASTLAYTTTSNNNVATVNDAVVDLYSKIYGYPIECYNGVCGKLSYRYWNDGFSETSYQSNALPTNTYATRALLEQNYGSSNFSSRPYYIRSVLIDGNVVGHQVCLWNNNKEYCMGNKYWAGTINTSDANAGTQTKIKLQRDMQEALGVTIADSSCYSYSYSAYCDVGSFYCDAGYGGYGSCGDDDADCYVNGVGSAGCDA